jgi:hypothetical protein
MPVYRQTPRRKRKRNASCTYGEFENSPAPSQVGKYFHRLLGRIIVCGVVIIGI